MVSFLSQLNGSSIKAFDLSFGSYFYETLLFSIASDNSSPNGEALTKSLLCLLGDFAKQTYEDSAVTVSLYVTIGSDFIISTPENSFSKSFKQISTCNSPHPAITCSPVASSVWHYTNGSDFDNFFNPSTNFGKSAACFGLTATLTTAETEYFIDLIVCASGWSEIVPVFIKY